MLVSKFIFFFSKFNFFLFTFNFIFLKIICSIQNKKLAIHGIQRSGTNYLCEYLKIVGLKIIMDDKKIDEASRLISLAIKDYELFLKEINNYTPEKKTEAISWLRNALKYVNNKNINDK